MKILVVVCHPRSDSLTSKTAKAFCEGASNAGHTIELLDLYKENFDPVLRMDDEPSDGSLESYSLEVQSQYKRLINNDAVVMVFPLWWWSMPAMLKGWIDRVWNYGLMYGTVKHNINKGLMLVLAGASEKQIQQRHYDVAINTNLNLGILNYCGVNESEVLLLDATNDGEKQCALHIKKAYEMGLSF